jgi:hypothetical protein
MEMEPTRSIYAFRFFLRAVGTCSSSRCAAGGVRDDGFGFSPRSRSRSWLLLSGASSPFRTTLHARDRLRCRLQGLSGLSLELGFFALAVWFMHGLGFARTRCDRDGCCPSLRRFIRPHPLAISAVGDPLSGYRWALGSRVTGTGGFDRSNTGGQSLWVWSARWFCYRGRALTATSSWPRHASPSS